MENGPIAIGGPLAYQRTGHGDPLVLLHGLGSRRQIWDPVVAELAEHCEVIAVDLRGFGASTLDGPAGVWAQIDAVAQLCHDLGLKRPHMAGNSMGGGIALELGNRAQARSVTAFSPIGFWHQPGVWWCQGVLSTLRRLAGAFGSWLPVLIRVPVIRAPLAGFVFGRPLHVDTAVVLEDVLGLVQGGGFAEACASFAGYRFEPAAALADVPTTIAWGRRDILLTFGPQHRRAARCLPAARHVALSRCGHTPFYDDPQACARTILATIRAAEQTY